VRLARWLGWDARHSLPALVLSFLLMCGGIAWFSIAPSALSYWLGASLAASPFIWFVANLGRSQGWDTDGPMDPAGDLSNGPWGPP